MPSQKKVAIVDKLSQKLKQAKSLVLTDYRGLTHQQLETLRAALKTINAEFVVMKNTLLKRALSDTPFARPEALPAGPTAILFSSSNDVAPLQELARFLTETRLKIKLGFFFGKTLSEEELIQLAKLPTKDVLLGQLVAQLQAPLAGLQTSLNWNLRQLVWTLNGIHHLKSQTSNVKASS